MSARGVGPPASISRVAVNAWKTARPATGRATSRACGQSASPIMLIANSISSRGHEVSLLTIIL
jgi:hypothetical protein